MLKLLFERMRESVEVMSRFHAERTGIPVLGIVFETTGMTGILRSSFLNRVLILPPGLKAQKHPKPIQVFNWLKVQVSCFVRDSYNAS